MREIVFRGKCLYDGEWKEGFFGKTVIISEDTYTASIIHEEDCNLFGGECYEVIPDTIGQYTGLTDKNGTKIFEGDIIRYADESEYRMYLESLECPEEYEGVNFNDMWTIDCVVYGIEIGYPAFDLNMHEWDCNGLSNLSESNQYFYEVIGNIHDNPELLKGGAE